MRSAFPSVARGAAPAAAAHRAAACALVLAAMTAQSASDPVPAVWREQHIHFVYLGRTSRYSCEGLRDKVRAMLLDLGARRDMKIVASGCEDSGRALGQSIAPALDIVFSAPVLSRAAAKPPHPGERPARDARFVAFTVTSDAFRNMGIGDCELVEEFSRQILPKLVTRDLRRDIACVPNQPSGSRFFVAARY